MRRLPFIAVNAGGVAAFALPLALATSAPQGAAVGSSKAPWLAALLAGLLIPLALSERCAGRLEAKQISLVAALCACAALLRLPISLAGANFFFFLPIMAGAVLGARLGFLVGSLGMATSALISGGVGPWLPFQMFAAGWVGAGAACIDRGADRLPVVGLAVYGALAAFFYGAVMNLWFWPVTTFGDSSISFAPGIGLVETIHRYATFYALTSLGWDAVGAVFNAATLSLMGGPAAFLLQRYRRRFLFDADRVTPAFARDPLRARVMSKKTGEMAGIRGAAAKPETKNFQEEENWLGAWQQL